METTEQWRERRIKEYQSEIYMCEAYIESSEPSKHIEHGVGKSYLNRRNSRLAGLHSTRLNEMKDRLATAKRNLEEFLTNKAN